MNVERLLLWMGQNTLRRKPGQAMAQALADLLGGYLDAISDLRGECRVGESLVDSRARIERVVEALVSSVEEHQKGLSVNAFMNLAGGLELAKEDVKLLSTDPKGASAASPLYRARSCSIGSGPDSLAEMFHIPVVDREKAAGFRFSVPGLPCLYLSGSAYCCWEELGRPSLDSLHYSRFVISEGSVFLNLAWHPSTILTFYKAFIASGGSDDGGVPWLTAYIRMWPVQAACSFKRIKPDEPFAPEYIIPQMVLEWIRQSGSAVGVMYQSNRCAWTCAGDFDLGLNFALPAPLVKDGGKLKSSEICLTMPFWLSSAPWVSSGPLPGKSHGLIKMGEDGAKEVQYLGTSFGQVERALEGMVLFDSPED